MSSWSPRWEGPKGEKNGMWEGKAQIFKYAADVCYVDHINLNIYIHTYMYIYIYEYRYIYIYVILNIHVYIYIPRTQRAHISEDLTHRMEGQTPPNKMSVGF